MDKCSKQNHHENTKRAGLCRLFLLIIFIVLFFSHNFAQGIPWTLESDFVCYFKAPFSWGNGFKNIEQVHDFWLKNQIDERNSQYLNSLSKKYNYDLSMIEELFQSEIIIINKEIKNDLFNHVENYLFDIEKQYHLILSGLNDGILIVERYNGLQELLEVLTNFDVNFIQQGDYLIASKKKTSITDYQKQMVNRNDFSEDVILYAETKDSNLTVTNAFSFLNIEMKELEPGKEIVQIPLQLIEIPLEFETPKNLFVFTKLHVKEFFYNRFEVISSVEEWKLIFDLVDLFCNYGFFYQNKNQWLIGFKSQNNLYQNDPFRNQILKWGILQNETIKPYANDYYLSVVKDYFLISNFKPEKAINKIYEYEVDQVLLNLQDKIGKRDIYKAGYEVIEFLGITMYFFSSFDDKINRQVIRIF